MRKPILISAAALILLAVSASGGTIILENGRKMSGEVRVTGDEVEMKTREGVVRIPRSRVKDVRQGVQQKEKKHEGRSRPMLRRKVTMDADGAGFEQVISRLRQATGAGFVLGPGVRSEDLPPVTMHVRKVTLKQVLDFLTDGSPLAYRTINRRAIRIGLERRMKRQELRIYDVRDRLYDRSDAGMRRRGGVRTQFGGSFGAPARSSVGGGGGRYGGRLSRGGRYGGYRGGGSGGGVGPPLAARAQSLAWLTTSLVHPQAWGAGRAGLIGEVGGGRYGGRRYGGYRGGARGGFGGSHRRGRRR